MIAITLDANALTKLIESDNDFAVKLKQSVLEEATRRYLRAARSEIELSFKQRLDLLVQEEMSEVCKLTRSWDKPHWELTQVSRDQLKQMAKSVVREVVKEAWSEAVKQEEVEALVQEHMKKYMASAVETVIRRNVLPLVQQILSQDELFKRLVEDETKKRLREALGV